MRSALKFLPLLLAFALAAPLVALPEPAGQKPKPSSNVNRVGEMWKSIDFITNTVNSALSQKAMSIYSARAFRSELKALRAKYGLNDRAAAVTLTPEQHQALKGVLRGLTQRVQAAVKKR